MSKQRITLHELHSFIRSDLSRSLAVDLKDHRILKEGDLEAAAYYYLRRFLRSDRAWRIFTRKHARTTGHFIDFTVFRKLQPKIALELKWNRSKMSSKDRRSLKSAVTKLRVHKGYFLATCTRAAPYQKIKKKEVEKNRIFEVIVVPGLSSEKLAQWKAVRQKFRE